MAATHFTGPILSGPVEAGQGAVVLYQQATINFNATLKQEGHIFIPKYSRLLDIYVDVLTAWDSGTSALLSVGYASAGVEYASGVDVKLVGRHTPAFTAAQLANMNGRTLTGGADETVDPDVYVTITSLGTVPTVGSLVLTLKYVQREQ